MVLYIDRLYMDFSFLTRADQIYDTVAPYTWLLGDIWKLVAHYSATPTHIDKLVPTLSVLPSQRYSSYFVQEITPEDLIDKYGSCTSYDLSQTELYKALILAIRRAATQVYKFVILYIFVILLM